MNKNTHRLFTLSAKALSAVGARDLQLISVVDKSRGALKENQGIQRKLKNC